MIRAEQQSPKAEGRIMPSALLHRFAARIIGTVLRLRAPAERYAQDDTREALRSGWHYGEQVTNAIAVAGSARRSCRWYSGEI